MKNLTNSNIVKEIIENVKDDMQNEEIIHLVLEKQVSHHNHQKMCIRDSDRTSHNWLIQ